MSSYPVPPPSYSAPASKQNKNDYGAVEGASSNQPLLPNQNQGQWASGSNAPGNEWSDEVEDGDVPEDFKIGVTVSTSSQSVRHAFISKVYGVLFCQILGTTLVGGLMGTSAAKGWVQEHSGLLLIPMFGAIATMIGIFVKRHSHPLNIILLGLFTVLEAITVGAVVSSFDQTIVLQALVITCFVFIGLTLFTFQSKYDFSGMGSYLFAGLLVFFMTGIIGLFIPYSRGTDAVIAGGGVLLFSMMIVYDTHLLLKRLHVDDWVLACVSLYLDILNLFLQILRLLSDLEDR